MQQLEEEKTKISGKDFARNFCVLQYCETWYYCLCCGRENTRKQMELLHLLHTTGFSLNRSLGQLADWFKSNL